MIARSGSVLSAVVLSMGALVAPAVATPAPENPSPWTPYAGSGWEVPAGEVCPFALSSEVLSDKERYRVAETYPDGSTKVEEWTGQLVLRFRNDETGEAVIRNLTGRGDFVYHQDGSWSLINVGGHIGVGLHPGDEPGPGFYVVSGAGFELHQDASGHRTFIPGSGKVENICDTLR
jgi:hypothetical protein